MKRILFVLSLVALSLSLHPATAAAASTRLVYKMAPGQVWVTTLASQSESSFMGKKDVQRTKTVIEYRVSKGPKKGWVRLTARILKQSSPSDEGGGGIDMSKLKFTAEMHRSGELRNIETSGSVMPQNKNAGAQEKAMMAQSSKMMADAWKNAVFWFPELPEEKLAVGDEFEQTRRTTMGGGMGMESKTVSKQVFTLEEISGGMAYFSVKDRSVTETKGMAGGKSGVKTGGKGETVFDIKGGMWTDMTLKSRSKVKMSNIPGLGGLTQESLNISKFRMERR